MKTKISASCEKENLKQIRTFVESSLRDYSLDKDTLNQIVLAVDEACANAIIHGNDCDESRSIDVELYIMDNHLFVEISDVGAIETIPEHALQKDVGQLVHEKRKGGMGMKLITAIMDDISYHQKDNRNTCVLMKKIS